MQNFSGWCKANTFKFGLNGGVGKMCVCKGKLAISQKRWKRAKVTSFQMRWKSSTLDDLESHYIITDNQYGRLS